MKKARKIGLTTINCPICDSTNHEAVYKKEYKLWNKGKLFIWPAQQVICKKCGMIFTNPQPTAKALERFYVSDIRFGRQSNYFRKCQVDFLKLNTASDCRTVFDIGAFNGSFLHIAKEKGYIVNGIEPSEEGVNEAKRLFNIKIIKRFFDKNFLDSFNKKFDIVAIRHVLEHVLDPIDFLDLAARLILPSRYIFVEVPDSSRPFAENMADFFSNQHIMYYTENSLRNIANVLGLSIVKINKSRKIPIIKVLFQKITPVRNYKQFFINEYDKNLHIIKDYKKQRNKFMKKLQFKINKHNINNLVIYGAGMHTSQLLQSGILDNININYIVDSNPKKWRMRFEGYKIESPKALKNKQNKKIAVLISSYDSQEEISGYLKKEFPNVVQIKLYDKIISYNKGVHI